jgi:UDP-N-acetyl-2-amino-2-deoxyglucuronate dehydrogenase
MNSKPSFAIIGCGRIAQRHAAEASKHGAIKAVCDIIKERADELAAKYNTISYYAIDDLLEKEKDSIDIVCICTPNGLHAVHSIKSLNAGKHVLCEKPMAIHSIDAAIMIEAAEKNNKKLFVVKQNRFNPPVSFIKKLLDEKKLGKIINFQLNCFWNRPAAYYKNHWHGTKELDGGILYTQFSHFIDVLYWFLGDLNSVTGYRSNKMHKGTIEFEDNGIALVEMGDKVTGTLNYSINAFQKNMEGSILLSGEKGTVKIGGQYLNELEYFAVEDESYPDLPKGKPSNQYGHYEGSMSNHDKVYEALLKAIDEPSYPLASAQETMKTVEIIEKIYKASPLLS